MTDILIWGFPKLQGRQVSSVVVDKNLIAECEVGGEALSGQINESVRAEIERRRRRRLLSEFLDALDAERGPVDEHLVSKYTRLLA